MIDVFIPTKNSMQTLPLTIKLVEKYIPVNNLIVADGASTDGTLEYADQHADIIIEEATPLGKARQLGLKAIETDIYASIDSDIQIPPTFMALAKHLDSPMSLLANYPTLFGYNCPPISRYLSSYIRSQKYQDHCLGCCIINTEALRSIGGYRTDMVSCEDRELAERAAAKGYRWITDKSAVALNPKTLMEYWRDRTWYGKGEAQLGEPVHYKRYLRPLLRLPLYTLKVHPTVGVIHLVENLLWMHSYSHEMKNHALDK